MKRSAASALVYSTEHGRHCRGCGQAETACICRSHEPAQSKSGRHGGILRISRESKGRKGRIVTVITGLAIEPGELQRLAGMLKKMCASGGTVQGGTIEIQGDHRLVVQAALQQRGFTAKIDGG